MITTLLTTSISLFLSIWFKILKKYAMIVVEVSCINLYSDNFKLSYLLLHIDVQLNFLVRFFYIKNSDD